MFPQSRLSLLALLLLLGSSCAQSVPGAMVAQDEDVVVPESQTTTMIEPRTLPLKKPAPASTILSVATEAGLTTLVAAIAAAGDPLLAAVKDPKTKVTVFGPTNEAFAKALVALKLSNVSALVATGLLPSILQFHIVASPVSSSAARAKGVQVPTLLSGQNLTVTKLKKGKMFRMMKLMAPSVSVTGYQTVAQVVAADVPAGASVVHVIDTVLVPDITKLSG